MAVAVAASPTPTLLRWRWGVLAAAFVAQIPSANMQYAWTLFTGPIARTGHWSLSEVQIAFSIFVILGTWLVPLNGVVIDRFGPRPLTLLGGALIGVSWTAASRLHSLTDLYVSYGIGGVGVGMVYGAAIATALKWFPDRRGLAVGIVAAGYGGGAVLSIAPIETTIHTAGFRAAFLDFGLLQAFVVMVAALLLTAPPEEFNVVATGIRKLRGATSQGAAEYTPRAMTRTPYFWIMYVMFVGVTAGGLMVTAQLQPIAVSLHMHTRTLLGGMTVLVLALQLGTTLNGFSRPLWGWISDRIGREEAMTIAFALEGIALLAFPVVNTSPLGFLAASGAIFICWGEVYSLFASALADMYGKRHAATNYGLLYTAKGMAAVWAGPLAARMSVTEHSWTGVFNAAAAANFVAAALAWVLLKRVLPSTSELPDATRKSGRAS